MAIGFSQPVELSWLDAAADWTASGRPSDEIRRMLDEMLASRIAVGTTSKKSSRYKRVCILMTTWVTPRPALLSFRDHALEIMNSGTPRVVIHYAMLSATYPFFWSICSQVGRMLRLQDEISMTQIKRRCKEALGERDTVDYASTRVIKTLVDLDLLKRGHKVGEYIASNDPRPITLSEAALLLEAGMLAEDKRTGLLESILTAPALFHFHLPTSRELSRHSFSRLSISGGEHGGERVTLGLQRQPQTSHGR